MSDPTPPPPTNSDSGGINASVTAQQQIAIQQQVNASQQGPPKQDGTPQQQVSANVTATASLQASVQTFGNTLNQVPWMQFQVTAQPNLSVFTNDPRVQAFLKALNSVIVNALSTQIITQCTQLIQKLTTDFISTQLVNITQATLQQITSVPVVGVQTQYQPLTPVGPIPPLIKPGNDCPPLFPDQKPINVPPTASDLGNGKWIWTKEVAPDGTVKAGARPFRKVVTTTCPVNRLTVDISADDYYTLYVNGKLVGSGKEWRVAQRYTVAFPDTTKVVIAAYGIQDPVYLQVAGVICAGSVWHSQEKSPKGTNFVTDATWKTISADNFDMAFIQPTFDDSKWEAALDQGALYGSRWGNNTITKPKANNVSGYGPPGEGALTTSPAVQGIKPPPKAESANVIDGK